MQPTENKVSSVDEAAKAYSEKMWGAYYDNTYEESCNILSYGECSENDFKAGVEWQKAQPQPTHTIGIEDEGSGGVIGTIETGLPVAYTLEECKKIAAVIANNKAFSLEETINEDKPVLIGKLNKPFGINGYKKAEVGHEVYELRDRYIIYLTSEMYPTVTVPFYKETLQPYIQPIKKA